MSLPVRKRKAYCRVDAFYFVESIEIFLLSNMNNENLDPETHAAERCVLCGFSDASSQSRTELETTALLGRLEGRQIMVILPDTGERYMRTSCPKFKRPIFRSFACPSRNLPEKSSVCGPISVKLRLYSHH